MFLSVFPIFKFIVIFRYENICRASLNANRFSGNWFPFRQTAASHWEHLFQCSGSKVGGRFEKVAQPGQMLHPGTLVARLEAQNGITVTKPTDFKASFVEWTQTVTKKSPINMCFANVVQEVHNVFDGYCKTEPTFSNYADSLVESLFSVLNEQSLPYEQMQQKLAVMKSRIKPKILNQLNEFLEIRTADFPVKKIRKAIEDYLNDLDPQKAKEEKMIFEPITRVLARFESGTEGHIALVLDDLLGHYYKSEIFFQEDQYAKSVTKLLSQVCDTERCVRLICSHTKVNEKNLLAMKILRRISDNRNLILRISPVLEKIASFVKSENLELAHAARTLLIEAETPTYTEIKIRGSSPSPTNLEKYDILFEMFDNNFDSVLKYVTVCCGVPEASIKRLEDGHPHDVQFSIPLQKIAHGLGLPNDEVVEISVTMRVVGDVADIVERLPQVAAKIMKPDSTLYIVSQTGAVRCDANLDEKFSVILKEAVNRVQNENIRQIVILIASSDSYPMFFYYDMFHKEEIRSQRNIDLAHLSKLGLHRIKENYNIEKLKSSHNSGHLYKAEGKADPTEHRFFYRAVVRVVDSYTAEEVTCTVIKALKRACCEIVVALYRSNTIDRNHVLLFIHRTPSNREIQMSPADWINVIYKAYRECKDFLWRSQVNQVEFDFILFGERRSLEQATKVIISDDTGFTPFIRVLRAEASSGNSRTKKWLHVDAGMDGFKHGFEIMVDNRRNPDWNPFTDPYLGRSEIDKRRLRARVLKTTYVYDYPLLFQRAVIATWLAPGGSQKSPNLVLEDLCQFHELVYDEGLKQLVELNESGSLSKIGIVAWRVRLVVPEYPEGREVIVIANDISHQIGSFSMCEHRLYYEASRLSRKEGIPRIYIAANSGARIGLSADLKKLFKVIWKNENNPVEGFDGLYLTNEEVNELQQIVATHSRNGFHQIDGIIGKERDLGVENLVGSGMIAGETSRAYNEVVTYCLVTGRTVGIGAYVARLSRRICQVENADIILTGAPALNSVLGREVYTSNGQLGGSEIMTRNGVTHSTVSNDYDGVRQLLRWLSYTRKSVKAPFKEPSFDYIQDPIDRCLIHLPSQNKESDPRLMMTIFDRNSFEEIKSGWGKTVITGRARLGGISVGVIAVETRSVFAEIPADPAAPDSQAKCIQQAGQVWYPDSAYKTAEAIEDFNKESLPLFILANWRGFSGGQKDMFEMVLKFGAYIVDQLCKYLNPVIVYIPPYGELRGGAWAVVDPTINPVCMQMFADPRSRGGVLEPEGTVQVKMRKDLVPLMRRLDKEMIRLGVLEKEGSDVKADISARIQLLMPTYRNIAITFADLHDTAVRMKAVGAIKEVVKWEESRAFFTRRLLRLCIEQDIYREAVDVKCLEDIRKMQESLQQYFMKTRDEAFSWCNYPDEDAIKLLRAERKQIVSFLIGNDFFKIGERYGIPSEKLEDFAKKCDQLIREMKNERL